MALGQVHHMDVVAHAGAVGGVVVVAEHVQVIQLARRHLGDEGHEVVGNAVGIFTDAAALVGADGVEVAQQHHAPLRVGVHHALQDFFDHVLGPAVGVGASLAEHVLPQRHLVRHAIHRG